VMRSVDVAQWHHFLAEVRRREESFAVHSQIQSAPRCARGKHERSRGE
jgi:hypothetical protein